MKNKSMKLRFPLGIVIALALIFGTVGQAFAAPPDHAEKVNVLISFTEKPGPAEQALIQNEGGKVKRNYHIVPTIAASVPKGKLDSLRRKPKVASVEEDITVQATQILPGGVDRTGAQMAQAQTKKGQTESQGVKVAILDTGIDLDHPDLVVAGNVSFVDGTINGDDDNGHGTMVAGVVAALDNDIGAVGVAPGVELYAVKVLTNEGWGYCSDMLSGIEWAIDNGMQVVNMSFGGFMNLPWAMRAAMEQAYQMGIVLVAGAGNGGDQDIIFAPARYEPVIAVGATDQQDMRASFSCTGPTLELMAPGVGILSTSRGGGYSSGTGTSFSTPYVTGMAAQLIASGVTNGIEVRQILQSMAKDLGPSGWDKWYGYGLVNAAEAVGVVPTDTASSDDADGSGVSSEEMLPAIGIELSGVQGEGGWYLSDVRVELTGVENPGGPGAAGAQYSLDGGKTWRSYLEPFTIANEGVTNILARSYDSTGNQQEVTASREVKIDKTGPSVNISVDPSLIWPAENKGVMADVLVTGLADDGISGLSSFQLAVKDEYGEVEPVIGSYLQKQIQLEARRDGNDLDGRVYTISITATDYAGNKATAETTVTVLHDRGKEKENNRNTGQEARGAADSKVN